MDPQARRGVAYALSRVITHLFKERVIPDDRACHFRGCENDTL